ncbi:hypothetical protein PF008_g15259 [Phytophthora fragariae]|uniref:Uncharacterized protein n=1 Tax=Phytophthora fragariae TaxID=53985 RepID=A0A6G0RFZ8_9STRA|nr:hypothetical protein PF008_g15259 [Phytophthora fragariae]
MPPRRSRTAQASNEVPSRPLTRAAKRRLEEAAVRTERAGTTTPVVSDTTAGTAPDQVDEFVVEHSDKPNMSSKTKPAGASPATRPVTRSHKQVTWADGWPVAEKEARDPTSHEVPLPSQLRSTTAITPSPAPVAATPSVVAIDRHEAHRGTSPVAQSEGSAARRAKGKQRGAEITHTTEPTAAREVIDLVPQRRTGSI